MRRFIREHVMSVFSNEPPAMDDAARLALSGLSIAITTDSFVVTPLFFPGGDIGSLAVYGAVNDLAVSGAKPLYLTLSLILEEGLPMALLDRVLLSVASAAMETGTSVVAGDTKVVPRGAADGLFINTTGVGQMLEPQLLGPSALSANAELIVSGPIGCHGAAVMCAREELALEPPPQSDSASLFAAAELLHRHLGTRLIAMRDATRGGVAAVLQEWAEASHTTLTVDEAALPVLPSVRGTCELLGLDPIHLANEGTMLVAVEEGAAQEAIDVLRSIPSGEASARIGTVRQRGISPVTVIRSLGREQPLDDPLGAPFPRIC